MNDPEDARDAEISRHITKHIPDMTYEYAKSVDKVVSDYTGRPFFWWPGCHWAPRIKFVKHLIKLYKEKIKTESNVTK